MTSCDAGRMTFFSLSRTSRPHTSFKAWPELQGCSSSSKQGSLQGTSMAQRKCPYPARTHGFPRRVYSPLGCSVLLFPPLPACIWPPSPGHSPERRCTIREQGITLKTQIDLLTNGAAAGAAAVRAVRDEIKGLTSAVYEGRKHFEQTTGAPKMVKKTAFSRGSSSIHG